MKLDDSAQLTPGAVPAQVLHLGPHGAVREDIWLAEETPVALEYNGISHAVMLATPCDLEDFALGFSLSEGIVQSASELFGVEVVAACTGMTVQIELAAERFAALKHRRRTLAGRTGCGLCGTESLDEAIRPVAPLPNTLTTEPTALMTAMAALRDRQPLKRASGAHHAAAWCSPQGEVLMVREDVGRHNALDKLIGALARARIELAQGFIAITSRASVEMVQKTATAGVQLLAAASVPTALAVRSAESAGLSLVSKVRENGMLVHTCPQRLAHTF